MLLTGGGLFERAGGSLPGRSSQEEIEHEPLGGRADRLVVGTDEQSRCSTSPASRTWPWWQACAPTPIVVSSGRASARWQTPQQPVVRLSRGGRPAGHDGTLVRCPRKRRRPGHHPAARHRVAPPPRRSACGRAPPTGLAARHRCRGAVLPPAGARQRAAGADETDAGCRPASLLYLLAALPRSACPSRSDGSCTGPTFWRNTSASSNT